MYLSDRLKSTHKQNLLSTLVIPFVCLAQPDEALIRQYHNYVHMYPM